MWTNQSPSLRYKLYHSETGGGTWYSSLQAVPLNSTTYWSSSHIPFPLEKTLWKQETAPSTTTCQGTLLIVGNIQRTALGNAHLNSTPAYTPNLQMFTFSAVTNTAEFERQNFNGCQDQNVRRDQYIFGRSVVFQCSPLRQITIINTSYLKSTVYIWDGC
jgi:hypothetical protein